MRPGNFIFKCFRTAKCYNHRRVIHHENRQGQNNCAIKSHAFLRLSFLRNHNFDQRLSRRAIRFPLPSLSTGEEQGRSGVTFKYSTRINCVNFTKSTQWTLASDIDFHSHVRSCHTCQVKAKDVINQAQEIARERRQSGFRKGSIERL